MPSTPVSPSITAKIDNATDASIAAHIPPWLAQASAQQINALRDSFKAHRDSDQRLRAATVDLLPLQLFAEQQLDALLAGRLPTGVKLGELQWLEVTPEVGRYVGSGWPYVVPRYARKPALLTLMQNFPDGASFYDGSGLVRPGTFKVLSGDSAALAQACRTADIGGQYQQLLERTFSQQTLNLLSDNKRAGLRLALEVAVLKGEIDDHEKIALLAMSGSGEAPQQQVFAYPGALTILGQPVADAMVIQLRGADGEDAGIILYLASEPTQPLRKFVSWAALTEQLTGLLRSPQYFSYFCQLIALGERPAFVLKLQTRLKDPTPDLELDGSTHPADIFIQLVTLQVAQAKENARLLLVPTAVADQRAATARLQAWEGAGMTLANLAGLFIPVVGALLLGQFVVQTLSQVYEGAVDWHLGHQHEALEHMLGVAESVAVAAAVVAGTSLVARGFARSDFVDGLEPVRLDADRERLWSPDLSPYASEPEDAILQPDGLYGAGSRRWIKRGQHYYEIHRPAPSGPWRLRHPRGDEAFGPEVQHNGERGWWLSTERPLEWDDNVRLLDTLWPHQPPLDAERTAHILRVAGVDQDELRGLLVENRPVPVNLRVTLRRFEADRRIDAFFADLHNVTPVSDDHEILDWCLARPEVRGLEGQALREALIADASNLRAALLEHLSRATPSNEALFGLLKRDFPGLADDYALALTEDADELERSMARVESRVPLTVAQKAHSLLQMARLNRALEGLYLTNAGSDETGELTFALLKRVPNWPRAANFELRDGYDSWRLVTSLDPQGDPQTVTALVRKEGAYRLYDSNGFERDVTIEEPAGLFEAIVALLTPEQLQRMGISAEGAAGQLRRKVLEQLPDSRTRLLQLLGWRAQRPWFNPGQRLADGRVGYPLSGRGRGPAPGRARATLRSRIRALYTGFTDAQVEDHLNRLMLAPGTAFSLLLAQENNYARLCASLEGWVLAPSQSQLHNVRVQIASRLRRAWRLQGEFVFDTRGEFQGMRLDLSGIPVASLPALPEGTDFEHVTALVLVNMRLAQVPTDFLRAFANLRRLNLSNNHLTQVPEGIAHLPDLRAVRLGRNWIRMTPAGFAQLAGLPHLSDLDLSFNPLGTLAMRFNQLSHLTRLDLRHCQLRTWPQGVELLSGLERFDLRNNQLASVPESILQMPLAYRQSILIDNNPLPARDRARLFRAEDHPMLHDGEGAHAFPADVPARALWLVRMPEADREGLAERWDAVAAFPDSQGVLQLLGELQRTEDYRAGQSYLNEHVWSLLQALESDSNVREQVFALANEPLTCEDSVIDRFSALQLQSRVAVLDRDGALHQNPAPLLALGRGLFRLERLEQFAREDIQARGQEGRGVDEIEVSLFYRVHLADQLQLPFQPRSMRFAAVARVSAQQLDQARAAVLAAQTDQALAESLSARTFWQHYLGERHRQLFAEIEQPFDQRGSEIDEQQATLTSEQYRQRWADLQAERQAAIDRLRVRLTLEILAEEGAEPGQNSQAD